METLKRSIIAICVIVTVLMLAIKIFDIKFDLLSYWCGMTALALSQIIMKEE